MSSTKFSRTFSQAQNYYHQLTRWSTLISVYSSREVCPLCQRILNPRECSKFCPFGNKGWQTTFQRRLIWTAMNFFPSKYGDFDISFFFLIVTLLFKGEEKCDFVLVSRLVIVYFRDVFEKLEFSITRSFIEHINQS